MRSEMEIMKGLKHENVVELLDARMVTGQQEICEQLCDSKYRGMITIFTWFLNIVPVLEIASCTFSSLTVSSGGDFHKFLSDQPEHRLSESRARHFLRQLGKRHSAILLTRELTSRLFSVWVAIPPQQENHS
jgi:serine/threonine protein kinase